MSFPGKEKYMQITPADNTQMINGFTNGFGNDFGFTTEAAGPQSVSVSGSTRIGGTSPGPKTETINASFNVDAIGGFLSPQDNKKVIDLTCDQTLVDDNPDKQIFGAEFPTNRLNYFELLVKCPSDCLNIALANNVYGLGIHPRESPICLSAIADRSVSMYGGIVAIGVYPGLKSYQTTFSKMFGIEIKTYEQPSMKSYVTAKVDNVDLVNKNIRILNKQGELNSRGRLEMRINGVWGTVCASGNDPQSAIVACKSMGYKFGKWGNFPNRFGPQKVGYCRDFDNEDHCGVSSQHIHFTNFKCSPSHKKLGDCSKQIAELTYCNHDMDSIIICSNENYEITNNLVDGIVKLALYKKFPDKIVGRVEVSHKGSYKPICAIGSNVESTTTLCRIMGYERGNYVFPAKDANPYKYSTNALVPFAFGAIRCKGYESDYRQCSSLPPILCKHDMDLIIECRGGDGDPTAEKQLKKKVINPPSLGKLPIPDFNIDCQTKSNNGMFRGDPGSVFIVKCPNDCIKHNVPVRGTGMYSDDSSICRAAIHAGVLNNELGGLVGVLKSYGNRYYEGSQYYGITSESSYQSFKYSFSVSKVNSGWQRMNIVFKSGHTKKILSFAQRIKKFLKDKLGISFLEMSSQITTSAGPTPLFTFLPPSMSHIFSLQTSMSVKPSFTNLVKFSIVLSFKMNFFNDERQYLFSFSGCGGFNVYIDSDDTLVFGDPCKPEGRVSTGIHIPLDDKIMVYITYLNGRVRYLIRSEKSYINESRVVSAIFSMRSDRNIGIGRLGESLQLGFNGYIDYIFVFNDELSEGQLNQVVSNIILRIQDTKRTTLVYTTDKRLCVSTCVSSNPPPDLNAGTPPREAYADPTILQLSSTNLNNFSTAISSPSAITPSSGSGVNTTSIPFSSSSPSSNNTINTNINSINTNPFTTNNAMDANNIETKAIECDTKITNSDFPKAIDSFIRVRCPSCNHVTISIFGTQIYHPLSSVCKAASHAGVLPYGQAGEILVTILGEKPAFNGSTGADGSISGTFGSSDRSFKVSPAPALVNVTCSTTAAVGSFVAAPIYARFVVKCPPKCSQDVTEIYGTEIYTDTSSICKAAIHNGILNDNGGEVDFMIEGGQGIYTSNNAFGVLSRAMSSYVRSFRFLGKKSSLITAYKENFQGNIFEKWSQEKHHDVYMADDDYWAFSTERIIAQSGEVRVINSIMHKGRIRANNSMNFASILKLKNVEYTNGYVLINVISYDPNPLGILFRFKDKYNYYGLILDFGKVDGNVTLVSMINTNYSILATKTYILALKTRYDLIIATEYDNIKIFIKSSDINENRNIISIHQGDLQRGTLALASYGNANFILPGIEITPNLPKHKGFSNTRTFTDITSKANERDKKFYCNKLFNDNQAQFNKCLSSQVYCKYKCDEVIPMSENIINFNCYTTCIKILKQSNDALAILQPNSWTPQPNSKVDFMPTSQSTFASGTVIKIENEGMDKYLTIEYMGDLGNTVTAKIKFSDAEVKPCGSVLTRRTDCLS
jgi:hypothetical protein